VGFAQATNPTELVAAIDQLGYPVILKSEEAGYDGKNQWRLKQPEDLSQFLAHYQENPLNLVIEQWVSFQAEVSMIAARNLNGEKAFYTLTENRHKNGILLTSRVPAPQGSDALTTLAQRYLTKLLDALDYVGVLAMECFVVEDQLLVNELAPRVHNSGHWTQQGSSCSQFENHVRAILDMSLGASDLLGQAAMLNLLGIQANTEHLPPTQTTLHWYGKTCKPGRKVGHINIQDNDANTVDDILQSLENALY
jgi:5-(carboxyamino)imidazole ribonucleotide synthase